MGRHMNEAIAINNVKPIRGEFENAVNDPEDRELNWPGRRLYELGAIDMPSTKPPGFYVNYSQVIFYLTVIAAILGGFWFMHDRIATTNYQKGVTDTEKKQLEKQLEEMKRDVYVLKEKKKLEDESQEK